MAKIQPVRGTRDFYPEDMAFRQWLYARIREASERFGYQEYDGPYLERLELYAAKSGEELVKEQSYVFPDRSGTMIALRPELTPSLARMVAQRGNALLLPLRWWSFGPFWRYERTQKGRSREFFQWNIDLIGVDNPSADAEVAAVAAALFQSIGLTPDIIRIKVNNRRLAERKLAEIGIGEDLRSSVFHLIDRRDKLDEEGWQAYALEIGLDAAQRDRLMILLEDLQAWQESDELVAFFEAAEALGAGDYLEYDPTIIRGLDYYTGTVYEARDVRGLHRAILGGGRYDDLVAAMGGGKIPATGFAMGDVVFRLLLGDYELLPRLRPNPADVFVTTFDENTKAEAMRLSTELRAEGFQVEWYPEAVRLSRQFKYADRQGIPFAVIAGPDEIRAGQVSLKDLRSGEQETLPRERLSPRLRKLIRGG